MKIAILGSGVALGVYIPAIYIYQNLKRRGISAEVFVLEDLLFEAKKNKINDNKIAFHRNFEVALLGQKMARDIMPSLDPEKLERIFERWLQESITYFIVVSGFWLPALELFKSRYPGHRFSAECLHMDSVISTSWKKVNYQADYCINRWLIRHDERRIAAELNISELAPVSFSQRSPRLLVHGGGWGMGTYQSKIPELKAAGFQLDIVAYEPAEVPETPGNDRYFITDPHWQPWLKNQAGEHQFPPTGQLLPGQETVFSHGMEHHLLFEVTREVLAVVSKPGGSTLLEALAAATPLIFLEPFGEYEAKNADLWVNLGFGIYYEDWKQGGYPLDRIRELHQNLLAAKDKAPKYPNSFLSQIEECS
ncbi:MAG TPA: UDP-glucuronosyltransferase [Bacillota bacterium]|nr:UDP-glucuronosyltransferase [Bacillota bacterium]